MKKPSMEKRKLSKEENVKGGENKGSQQEKQTETQEEIKNKTRMEKNEK